MQKRGHQCFRFSPCKQEIGIINGLPPESDFSWSSTKNGSQSTFLSSTKSWEGTSRGFIGALFGCFIPRVSEIGKKPNDVSSISASRTSTISSSSQSRITRFSGSQSLDDTGQRAREFSAADIYEATGNLSAGNIIGHGGFGTVYKGTLKDGSLIAVKRAKKNLYQQLSSEFSSEIQILSKVEHLNLVRFLGYLEHDDERIVVVEYVGNGTLRQHLDGHQGDVLELAARLDIAIDVAHGVTYLHMYADHPIIHRDIKASNILLTENLRAKVADFGFARLAAEDPDATHVSTQIKGTAGYLDPEYVRTYQLTEKSDVYSFGILLVELVTGRIPVERNRNLKERITAQWAMQKLKEGDAVLAMDPRLRRSPAAVMAIERVLKLAGECLAASRRSRPSMKKCAEVLWGIRRDYRGTQLPSCSSHNVTCNAE